MIAHILTSSVYTTPFARRVEKRTLLLKEVIRELEDLEASIAEIDNLATAEKVKEDLENWWHVVFDVKDLEQRRVLK